MVGLAVAGQGQTPNGFSTVASNVSETFDDRSVSLLTGESQTLMRPT